MNRQQHRGKFWVFLILALVTTLALVGLSFILVPMMNEGGQGTFPSMVEWARLFTERAPYILQAFINLVLFIGLCLCGARLYAKKQPSKRLLLGITIFSLLAAIFLHAMVYGIDLVFPSPYSLLAPYGRPLVLFPLVYGQTWLSNDFVAILLHALAPQVLLGVGVSWLASKEYRALS